MNNLDSYDVEELAADILGLEDWGDCMIDDTLWDRYEASFEDFEKVVNMIIDYTPTVQSPLTGTLYHAFVKNGVALVKKPV